MPRRRRHVQQTGDAQPARAVDLREFAADEHLAIVLQSKRIHRAIGFGQRERRVERAVRVETDQILAATERTVAADEDFAIGQCNDRAAHKVPRGRFEGVGHDPLGIDLCDPLPPGGIGAVEVANSIRQGRACGGHGRAEFAGDQQSIGRDRNASNGSDDLERMW